MKISCWVDTTEVFTLHFIDMTFNKTFNFILAILELNLSKFAREIQVNRSTVHNWKTVSTPKQENIKKVIKYLNYHWQEKHFNFYPKWNDKEVTQIDFDFLINGEIKENLLADLMKENYKEKEKELINNFMKKVV